MAKAMAVFGSDGARNVVAFPTRGSKTIRVTYSNGSFVNLALNVTFPLGPTHPGARNYNGFLVTYSNGSQQVVYWTDPDDTFGHDTGVSGGSIWPTGEDFADYEGLRWTKNYATDSEAFSHVRWDTLGLTSHNVTNPRVKAVGYQNRISVIVECDAADAPSFSIQVRGRVTGNQGVWADVSFQVPF